MFVTDGVERAGLDHRGHIALLKHPNAIVGEYLVNIAHEGDRILQVVEHRKGRDNLCLLPWKAVTEQSRRKEIGN